MSDMGWRDKNDLDLTSADISVMASEGELVGVRGPTDTKTMGIHIRPSPGLKFVGLAVRDFDQQGVERPGVLVTR